MRLSHTKIETYKLCPKKYELRYLKKLIPKKYFSSFMFGTAIDDAIGLICLLKMKNPTPKQKIKIAKLKKDKEYPYRLFDNIFAFQKPFEKTMDQVGEKGSSDVDQIDVRKHYLCEYFPSDFDADLLEAEDYRVLKKYMKTAGYEEKDPIKLWNDLEKLRKDEGKLTDIVNKEFYNYCCFLSLRKKARVLLDIFRDEILPQIKEIHTIQEYVKLENENGDKLIGFIDLIGVLEGEDFPRVIDIKTSSARYKADSVETSQQLGIYTEYKDTDKGAYIVLLKKPKIKEIYKCFNEEHCDNEDEYVGKRRRKCPKCREDLGLDRIEKEYEHQIVKGEINNDKKDLLFEEISDIIEDMETQEYEEKGLKEKSCFHFGRKCDY